MSFPNRDIGVFTAERKTNPMGSPNENVIASIGPAVATQSLSTDEAFLSPASFPQQRLWSLEQKRSSQPANNMAFTGRVHGQLDLAVMERTLQEVFRRHESLRTHFALVNGLPHQVITQKSSAKIEVVDLGHLAGDQQEAEAKRQAQERVRTPFDLTQPPLHRTTIFRLGEKDHILLLNLHHIICDGWSTSVLYREISILYEAFSSGRLSPLPELPIQYADFSSWQIDRLNQGVLERQLAYWQQQLAGARLLELPGNRPPVGNRAANSPFAVPADIKTRLENLAREDGASLFMVLFAALLVVLHRMTGNPEIVIGSPIAGRSRPELENLIGCFTNILVFRADFSGSPTFREALLRVKKITLDAYENSDIPLDRLLGLMQTEKGVLRPPVEFVFQNTPPARLQLGRAELLPFPLDTGVAKIDLTLFMGTSGDTCWGRARYNADLFAKETIDLMLKDFQRLLQRVANGGRERIADIPLSLT